VIWRPIAAHRIFTGGSKATALRRPVSTAFRGEFFSPLFDALLHLLHPRAMWQTAVPLARQ